jgi:hypothetical protein
MAYGRLYEHLRSISESTLVYGAWKMVHEWTCVKPWYWNEAIDPEEEQLSWNCIAESLCVVRSA